MGTNENVNHPQHYNAGGIEVIDVIEQFGLGFELGNAVKYICRAGKKSAETEREDLMKAVWYLNRYLDEGCDSKNDFTVGMKVRLDEYGVMPSRAHDTDAGLDIFCPTAVYMRARSSAVVRTGVHIELPEGTVGLIKSKSGLNVKHEIVSEGVIDEGYSGEIVVKLYNNGDMDYTIQAGDKITQLLVMPVMYVKTELADSITGGERGENGFGSTDVKH